MADLGLEAYGYGANAGDPAGFAREAYLRRQAAQLQNNQVQYDQSAQQGADTALANPQTAAALIALSRQNTPATAPFPGQSSVPQGQQVGGGQPMPPIMPVTQDMAVPASQLRRPIGGGPGLSVMPGGPIPPPPSPSQIPNNPFGNGVSQQMPQDIPGAEPMPQAQTQPNVQQLIQQYPTPGALISAVQQANPGISGASLSRLIQQVMPLYQNRNMGLTPYQQLEVQTRQQQIAQGQQRNERLQGALDLATKKSGLGYVADRARANLGGKVAEATAIADTAIEKQIPKAEELYSHLPRSSMLALGSVQNFIDNQTNDPYLAKLKPVLEGIAREYARAMGGTGNVAVANLNHARDLLGTSKDLEAFKAAMDGLKFDIQVNKEAASENVPTGGRMSTPSSGSEGISVSGNAPPEGLPEGAKQAPDGNYYVPDPKRPGKYLQVVQ